MSQKSDILAYIQEHGSINPKQAYRLFGCMRLAPRILELRKEGYNIINTNDGKLEKFACYVIDEKQPLITQSLEAYKQSAEMTPQKLSELKCVGVVQVEVSCTGCGSFYRQENQCNICGRGE